MFSLFVIYNIKHYDHWDADLFTNSLIQTQMLCSIHTQIVSELGKRISRVLLRSKSVHMYDHRHKFLASLSEDIFKNYLGSILKVSLNFSAQMRINSLIFFVHANI